VMALMLLLGQGELEWWQVSCTGRDGQSGLFTYLRVLVAPGLYTWVSGVHLEPLGESGVHLEPLGESGVHLEECLLLCTSSPLYNLCTSSIPEILLLWCSCAPLHLLMLEEWCWVVLAGREGVAVVERELEERSGPLLHPGGEKARGALVVAVGEVGR